MTTPRPTDPSGLNDGLIGCRDPDLTVGPTTCRPFGPQYIWVVSVVPNLTIGAIACRHFVAVLCAPGGWGIATFFSEM